MLKYIAERVRRLIGTLNRYAGVLSIYVLGGLALGTLAFAFVLHSAYGILPANLFPARRASGPATYKRVALLDSNYSAAAYEKMQGNHRAQVEVWSTFLKASDNVVHRISDAELEQGLDSKFQALVLPGSLALSELELDKIRRFVRGGGGLIMEGPVGTRDRDGRWRSWDFLKDLINVDGIEILKPQGQTQRFVTLAGGFPISVQLPPGLKVENGFYSENYGLRSDAPEAYWSEWVRPVSQPSPHWAALKTVYYGAGRVVWFGFNLNAMSEQPEPHQAMIRLLTNATDWVTQQPLAQVALWPHTERGAITLTFDCESDFTNLSNLFDLPEAEARRFTFFMLSYVAQKYPDLVKQAAARGEIAVHGDDHTSFSQQPYETQVQRLLRARSVLELLGQTPILSFRPPEQGFDANTLAAMRKLGLQSLFADYLGAAAPRLEVPVTSTSNFWLPFHRQDSVIVRMPRSNYDDYDLFARQLLDAKQAAEAMVADMNQITRDGGLYVSSMHTTAPWGGLNADKIPALRALLQALSGRPLWITTVKEAADWWEKRARAQVTVTKYSDSVVFLQVTNSNNRTLENLPIEVYLPPNYAQVDVQSAKVEFQTPKWNLSDGGRLIIYIPAIKAGDSKSYIITDVHRTS